MSDDLGSVHPEQASLEAAASRPSKNNPSDATSGANEPESGPALDRRKWWHRKNELVDEWLDDAPARAARPIPWSARRHSAMRRPPRKPREELEYRSRSWSSVLREFLNWYNGYRFSHLRFRSPEGDRPLSDEKQLPASVRRQLLREGKGARTACGQAIRKTRTS